MSRRSQHDEQQTKAVRNVGRNVRSQPTLPSFFCHLTDVLYCTSIVHPLAVDVFVLKPSYTKTVLHLLLLLTLLLTSKSNITLRQELPVDLEACQYAYILEGTGELLDMSQNSSITRDHCKAPLQGGYHTAPGHVVYWKQLQGHLAKFRQVA